ncbi:CubicO group peptidase (beta-lactamase class C family) [Sediminihabitans luteus]|uniref:CubicO group peptidase (Beta-lactamase class C family) n=1 Tax=Sediminihabitans luteus TaxID=1138585 RepID=A0A2M9CBU7_9CELL|nr:serine hydrolase domain-containing protein [Sediminihabitans luteus]PJJ68535.1 CubicO group peptidase (beta-lactamase class C family) [Sediminihabitans luteus]GII99870.1 hypothetical protein Slu03_22480 [Sediminihabitans luteus]
MAASVAALVRGADGSGRASWTGAHGPDAVVCWASVTKIFTAALCHALVDAGSLTSRSTVTELVGVDAPPIMTVQNLVEHRAGAPVLPPGYSHLTEDNYGAWTAQRFDEQVMGRLADVATAVTPRSVPEYSNVGYAVLTRSLERAFRRPWIDLVREHVLAPVGVDPGAFAVGAPSSTVLPPAVRTLQARGRLRRRTLDDWDVTTGPFAGAGGLASTVPAMADVLDRVLDQGGPLHPGRTPHAWSVDGARAGVQGALMRSGSIVLVDTDTRSVGVAHVAGGLPGWGDRLASRALRRLVESTGART